MPSTDQASLGVWNVSIPGPRIQRTEWCGSAGFRRSTCDGSRFDGTSIEKLRPEPRRQHRTDNCLAVFQDNCESLLAPDRLCELMALAREQPLDVHKVRCSMVSVSGPITGAISFHTDQYQVCSHSDHMYTQCGEGRRAGDLCVISAYAPVHDERTQTVTSESLRIEFCRC